MNKAQLIEAIANDAGLTKAAATKALEATLGNITKVLAERDTVALIGFGTFASKLRAARTGRNPKTGEEIQIEESWVVNFKAGKALKEALNETETA